MRRYAHCSDVTRVFPANGKFTSRQREFYTIYLQLYQALMTSIKVHVAPRDIIKVAVGKMDTIMGSFHFTDDKIKKAATLFVERYRTSSSNSLGHSVGMEVHDVRAATQTLEPGQIFIAAKATTPIRLLIALLLSVSAELTVDFRSFCAVELISARRVISVAAKVLPTSNDVVE